MDTKTTFKFEYSNADTIRKLQNWLMDAGIRHLDMRVVRTAWSTYVLYVDAKN